MFLMWLGEQITERGVGNGISLIIFSGIVAGMPSAIGGTLELARTGAMSHPVVIGIVALCVVVTYVVVFVERGQRKILVNYAKRQVGNKLYGGQSSHLPPEIEHVGRDPADFRLLDHPVSGHGGWLVWPSGQDDVVERYRCRAGIRAAASIRCSMPRSCFLCFFYTALVFNPKETAENLKKAAHSFLAFRPGEQTARYIDKI